MTDKYRIYVGQKFPVQGLSMLSGICFKGKETIITDRRDIGTDVEGNAHYTFRLDAGNPAIELWVNDDVLIASLNF